LAFGHDVASWVWERPATTLVGSFCPDVVAAPGYRSAGDESRQDAEGSIRITIEDALVLQDFRPDYPVAGSRTSQFQQVGNAIPVGLARAALAEVLG
jgi:DNA (cytosine-5)-methyltransferase 1